MDQVSPQKTTTANNPQSNNGKVIRLHLDLAHVAPGTVIETLEEIILAEPRDLILNLTVFERGGSPNAALAALDILQKRNRLTTRLTTRAWTLLPPPEAIIWLVGDLRDATAHSGLVLPGLGPESEKDDDTALGRVTLLHHPDELHEWAHLIKAPAADDLNKAISEYVELRQSPQILRFDDLKECGLIGDQFQTLLGGLGQSCDLPNADDSQASDEKEAKRFPTDI